MKKKVCKQCKRFYEENQCPVCKSNQIAGGWQGRLNILNSEQSLIAKQMKIEHNGEYAIKVR